MMNTTQLLLTCNLSIMYGLKINLYVFFSMLNKIENYLPKENKNYRLKIGTLGTKSLIPKPSISSSDQQTQLNRSSSGLRHVSHEF
jgi:hypothetical protein